MATIEVKGQRCTATVLDTTDIDSGDEPWYVARTGGGLEITDRGNFQDTMQAAEIHVDRCEGDCGAGWLEQYR